MKSLLTFLFLFLFFDCSGQRTRLLTPFSFNKDCDIPFVDDKYINQKNIFFYIDGIENSKPYVEIILHIFNIKEISDTLISLEVSAGMGTKNSDSTRDYSSLTKNILSIDIHNFGLYFVFEDRKSFHLTSGPDVKYHGNIVYLNKIKDAQLVTYFKTVKLTNILFEFNEILENYSIPTYNTEHLISDQSFFRKVVNCIRW